MYKGSSVCQGCGRPGSEAPRLSKKRLCPECANMIMMGVAVQQQFHQRVLVVDDGDVYCNGQLCYVCYNEDSRCNDCALGDVAKKLTEKKT